MKLRSNKICSFRTLSTKSNSSKMCSFTTRFGDRQHVTKQSIRAYETINVYSTSFKSRIVLFTQSWKLRVEHCGCTGIWKFMFYILQDSLRHDYDSNVSSSKRLGKQTNKQTYAPISFFCIIWTDLVSDYMVFESCKAKNTCHAVTTYQVPYMNGHRL